MLPDHAHSARRSNIRVARHQRQRQGSCGCDNQRIERIAGESQLVGEVDLLQRQIQRVIGRVAEEIVEEGASGTPQVDPAGTCQQTDFPNHGRRDVDEGLLALAGLEVCRRPTTQRPIGRRVKQEGMSIGDDGRKISHDGVSAWPA